MTPEYAKAARALLRWSQAKLAAQAQVSLTALKAFESGQGRARSATVAALRAALETGGVEFMPGGGLRRADETVQSFRFSGKDCIQQHNELIYATLRANGGELLTCSPDDALWTGPLARKANAAFREWRRKRNVRGKTLACQGAKVFNEPRQQYRFLPPEMLGTITYVIYGNRMSFILWAQKKVFVLQNAPIVDTFRRQFEYLWALGRKEAG